MPAKVPSPRVPNHKKSPSSISVAWYEGFVCELGPWDLVPYSRLAVQYQVRSRAGTPGLLLCQIRLSQIARSSKRT